MRIASALPAPEIKHADTIRLTLRRYALRHTAIRRAVLAILLQSPCALSGNEIEEQLAQATDRITLYRTLRTFEQKGLLHRVVDHGAVVRYAMSGPAPTHTHVHFKCTCCQRLFCLHEVAVPAVELPELYRVTSSAYLLSGCCAHCSPA